MNERKNFTFLNCATVGESSECLESIIGEKKDMKKILIADDDPAILEAMKLLLEDANYQVETTLSGIDVLKLQTRYLSDLILLDIRMSGVDGCDICKQLKTQDSTRSIPIIIVSANRDAERRAKEAGADDFLSKPFQITMLLRRIETQLITNAVK